MASVFTRIMAGELPARFVYEDALCAAFLTIDPLRPGHVLVVPREEVEHWVDLDPELLAHLARVAQRIGRALDGEFGAARVGLAIVGLEVPHVHLHLTPIDRPGDLEFTRPRAVPGDAELDAVAGRIRRALSDADADE